MADGSAQQRGCLLEGGDAGEGGNLDDRIVEHTMWGWRLDDRIVGHRGGARLLLSHFVEQGSHAVDAGIARGDDHHRLALLGQTKGLFGPFPLVPHASVYTFTALGHVGFYEAEVILVSDDGISPAYCFEYGGGDVFLAARSDACNDNLSHSAYKDNAI